MSEQLKEYVLVEEKFDNEDDKDLSNDSEDNDEIDDRWSVLKALK